jgi:hypothetical protein
MMNKRAQIPIFMLLVVAIALVITAILVFVNASGNFTKPSLTNSQMISGLMFAEDYVNTNAKIISGEAIASKAPNMKEKFMEIAAGRDLEVREAGNFFAKIRTGDFSFDKKGTEYALEIRGLFIQSDKEAAGSLRRDFDLCMVFDANGQFLRNCEIVP